MANSVDHSVDDTVCRCVAAITQVSVSGHVSITTSAHRPHCRLPPDFPLTGPPMSPERQTVPRPSVSGSRAVCSRSGDTTRHIPNRRRAGHRRLRGHRDEHAHPYVLSPRDDSRRPLDRSSGPPHRRDRAPRPATPPLIRGPRRRLHPGGRPRADRPPLVQRERGLTSLRIAALAPEPLKAFVCTAGPPRRSPTSPARRNPFIHTWLLHPTREYEETEEYEEYDGIRAAVLTVGGRHDPHIAARRDAWSSTSPGSRTRPDRPLIDP